MSASSSPPPPPTTLIQSTGNGQPLATSVVSTSSSLPPQGGGSSWGGVIIVIIIIIGIVIIAIAIVYYIRQHRVLCITTQQPATYPLQQQQRIVTAPHPITSPVRVAAPPPSPAAIAAACGTPPIAASYTPRYVLQSMTQQRASPMMMMYNTPRFTSAPVRTSPLLGGDDTNPSINFENLPPNTQQCFVITAQNECGEGIASEVQCIQLACDPPSAPTDLTSTASFDVTTGFNISFQWSASTNATAYDVIASAYAIDPNTGNLIVGPPRALQENLPTATAPNVSLDAPIQSYRIVAKNNCPASTPSEVISTSTALPAPTNLQGTPVQPGSADTVNLTWDAVEGAIGYWVIRRRTDGYVTTLTNVNRLENVTTEGYSVFAVSAVGTDGGSGPLSDYVPMCPTPGTVTGVTLNQVSNNVLNVSWNSVPGAASYRVYRGTDRTVTPRNYTDVTCYPPGVTC